MRGGVSAAEAPCLELMQPIKRPISDSEADDQTDPDPETGRDGDLLSHQPEKQELCRHPETRKMNRKREKETGVSRAVKAGQIRLMMTGKMTSLWKVFVSFDCVTPGFYESCGGLKDNGRT